MEPKSILSEDFLEEILVRLTVRRLLRLRCISKQWRSIIDKSSFIHKHCQFQYSMLKEEGDVPLFCDKPSIFGLEEDPTGFYLLSKKLENVISCLTPDLIRDSSPYFNPDEPDTFNSLFCVGAMNGVALVRWNGEYTGLWNPATREFKAIPHPRPNQPKGVQESIANFIGLGFDSKTNDFKIIRTIEWMIRKEDGEWEKGVIYEMYSVKLKSWKNLEFPFPNIYMNSCVSDGYFNGVHFWPANDYETKGDVYPSRFGLLAFDFSTEVFNMTDPPPPACKDGPKWEWCLAQYKDSLATVFTGRNEEEKVCHFEVWVVTKFDDDDPTVILSWQYLFRIGPVPEYDGLWFNAFVYDGDMVLTVQGGEGASDTVGGHECAIYSPTTCSFKRLGVGLASCLIYVESLFSLSKM